ncbi:PE/PPE C-terminal domain-containing protein [Paenibacillus sp. S150]|uniref:PE/PPE C-terminal domain-containing protein n=1 Tax=Paenibacillus sp. S150 TaxID=2749826 RepID=UPI001C55CF75|nr:PE/PPE C-terminal domain-containing protein [Paenibacillus sp. S150]MBW4080830.1 PE/PPE C-terminal domain-containing protein [Paenibacillus sp. S150]
MTNPVNKHTDQTGTDEAWAKMQKILSAEPVNPAWAAWGQRAEPKSGPSIPGATTAEKANNEAGGLPMAGSAADNKRGRARRPLLTRRRKWAVAAAGVAVFAAVLATPVGNTAMAAILGQFRVQEVTVVNEDDLRNIFYQLGEDGNFNETVNKFGSFSTSYGTVDGEVPVDALQAKLGYAALTGGAFDNIETVYINNSREVTLTLKVDEVNKALKHLGAKQLLPASIDGKPVTLHIPESVNYDLSTDNDHWATLMQMNTPVVNVDPSVNIEEAVQAVLDFPLLPDEFKSNLQRSSILAGDLPMPLVKGDHSEQITVDGIKVILETVEYGNGPVYKATWVNKGQLLELSGGSLYQDKEKFMNQLQELITQ